MNLKRNAHKFVNIKQKKMIVQQTLCRDQQYSNGEFRSNRKEMFDEFKRLKILLVSFKDRETCEVDFSNVYTSVL